MAANSYPINIIKAVLANLFSFGIFAGILMIIGIIFLFVIPFFTIGIFIFLGFILIISFFSFVINYFYLKNLSYEVNDKNFILRGGIIGKFEKILPYSKLQHVIVTQSLGQRILGIATVIVQDASQQVVIQSKGRTIIDVPTIPGLMKEDAIKLRNFLLLELIKTKSGQGL